MDPPPESPVTPAYGSPPTPYVRGQATPLYSSTEQYPLVYQVSPAARRRSRLRLLAGITIGVVVLLLACIGGVIGGFAIRNGGLGQPAVTASPSSATRPATRPTAPPPTTRRAPAAPAGGHLVVYEVTGDGPVGITYLKDARGATEQVRTAELPWRVELHMDNDSFVVTVMALRLGTDQGSLTCRALVDGREVARHASSRGHFATTTCAHLFLG